MSDLVVIDKNEPERIHASSLDDVMIGDFYWVKDSDEDSDEDKTEETLMCVDEIGSNYVGFSYYSNRYGGGCRVHFDNFDNDCRREENWREILQGRMSEIQKKIQHETKMLQNEGRELAVISSGVQKSKEDAETLLPAPVTIDPNRYKSELVAFKEGLPERVKKIEELGEDFAVQAKMMALPDLSKLACVKKSLEKVEDHIFTIEVYCGLQERVHRIAEGEPAPADIPISIHQQMLYMDEETLFRYGDGGMDFKDIGMFDKWVVSSENLNRILPDQRGIVAFRVRRNEKNYGRSVSLGDAWQKASWAQANKETYLLIRNGENVYRIASEVDFSPRLIPCKNEIGKEQFIERDSWWNSKKDGYEKTEEIIDNSSVKYDECVEKMDKLIKKYNRIIILLQGLLDRSPVFHPHPPINLCAEGAEKWLVAIRDEELGLPSNKMTFDEYRKQLNSTVKIGKWIIIERSFDDGSSRERWDGTHEAPKRGYGVPGIPKFCKVQSVKRDRSAVKVSWPWGKRTSGGRWGTDYGRETGRMCHEWVPFDQFMNASDYTPGDYKMLGVFTSLD